MDPLTPADCDLRDFAYMQLDVVRLFGSEFHALASDSAWRAGVTLWLKSWHQVPAGSLPEDEAQLARLAELGRDTKAWRKIKDQALRGWQRCSDGRLYHRVVSEKALEAWLEKLRQRLSSGAGNAKRWKIDFDPTPIEADIETAATMLAALAPRSRALAKVKRQQSKRDPGGSATGDPAGTHTGTPDAIPPGVPVAIPSGSQGTGTISTVSFANAQDTAADDPPPDLKKLVFDRGVAVLVKSGRSEPSARSAIAQLQRDFGNPAVIDAIDRCGTATEPLSAMKSHLGKAKAQAEYLGV
jgi:hypothetical protein